MSSDDCIKKVALVSHDYNEPGTRCLYDYSEHFTQINRRCDELKCDTVLYAPFTWNRASPVVKNHDAIFGQLNHVRRVILELWPPPAKSGPVEVWLRDQQNPVEADQFFATSGSSDRKKQAFINGLPNRIIVDALLVLCGETNIVKTPYDKVNKTWGFEDEHHFVPWLEQHQNIRVILNPVHDYMGPPRDEEEAAVLFAQQQDGHFGMEPGKGERAPRFRAMDCLS